MSQQLVVSNNSGQKLIENFKRDKRKLVKHLKNNNVKMKKTTHTKQEHTHVKNLKRQLMTKQVDTKPYYDDDDERISYGD